MQYLLLAIISSSLIAIIFKFSETNNLNRYAVTTMNYLTAFSVSLFLSIKDGILLPSGEGNFIKEFSNVVLKNNGLFTPYSSFIWATIIGCLAGLFFFLSFIYYQISVRENNVGLAGTFGKLGILVPMSFSIVLWREFPTEIQWIGIILSIISIIIVNVSFKKNSIKDIHINLILLFFFGGMAEFSNKIFQKYALSEYKSLFLFFVFFIAFIISLMVTIKRNKPVETRDIITGILVGIPNLFSSFFLIMALNYMKTSVVFPIYSAGSIVIITLAGTLFFKERLKNKEIIAIVMTIVALILINIQ
ncbi:EamA family transporter [Clostridium sp. D2Q-11]|uniref:EamA family transporter n=1 Tax=Anaeromonas frigoriresistens TaxID=2683708 RepID=A0A942Z7W6_9FIRM|nr:SMR family transporter [Anaeromonas frigoriresistens]MBS4537683.1 EamA family transporter [Anaeromonas frigoriresistens]